MTAEASLPSSTAEDVERLAAFMGWNRSDDPLTIGEAYNQGATPVLFAFTDGSGFGVAGFEPNGRWDPFTDPRADFEVLERVREVWGPASGHARSFLRAVCLGCDITTSVPAYAHAFVATLAWNLSVGTWARACLAVLREMEEG